MQASDHSGSIDAVVEILYDVAPAPLQREIEELVDRAYGSSDTAGDDPPPLHDPVLRARSFYLRVDGQIVSYAGVVTKSIRHAGQSFTIAGLSNVATDPELQRRGYGRRVVAAATRFIERSGIDLGLFTCAPELVPLYAAAGSWEPAPDVILVGNAAPDALNSGTLGVVVLMRLFSPQAQAAAASLRHGTIDLDLPSGQFL